MLDCFEKEAFSRLLLLIGKEAVNKLNGCKIFKEPMFVKQIDPIKNEVVLSNEIGLFQNVVFAKIDSLYITKSLKTSKRCTAKIRFSQAEEEIKILNIEDDIITVYFKNPQRAVAKGQALVLYEKDYVLGGGEIC